MQYILCKIRWILLIPLLGDTKVDCWMAPYFAIFEKELAKTAIRPKNGIMKKYFHDEWLFI